MSIDLPDSGEPQTLWSRLYEVSVRDPAKVALVGIDDEGNEHRVTYSMMVEAVGCLSASLAGMGVQRGDRVALTMTNRVEWVYTFFAVSRIGGVLVPINTRLQPDEMGFILGNSRANHAVWLDRFRNRDYADALSRICIEWNGSGAGKLNCGELPDLRNIVIHYRDKETQRRSDAWCFETMLEQVDQSDRDLADTMERSVLPSDLGMIKYTSGSTGFPKGVMLSQEGCVRAALLATQRLEIGLDDRWFSAAPFFHVGGSVWSLLTAILRGGTLVFTETHDSSLTLKYAQQESCTVIYGVPAMIRDLLAELRVRSYDLSAVRLVSATDSALAEEVRSRIPSLGTPINAFGLTETFGPFSVLSPHDSWEKKSTTCGRLLPGNELRVIDPESGAPVEFPRVGEALLRGGIMQGYWEADGEAASAIDEDGWFHSGDLVTVDDGGYVTWVGRLKAMLKIGGENVSAEEVENCLQQHPAVLHAVVVGVPDPRLDQVGYAFIVQQRDASTSSSELTQWCTPRLARFKIPPVFQFLTEDQLPMTGSGKIDRAKAQALAAESISASQDH